MIVAIGVAAVATLANLTWTYRAAGNTRTAQHQVSLTAIELLEAEAQLRNARGNRGSVRALSDV
jgi:hypothetical protein